MPFRALFAALLYLPAVLLAAAAPGRPGAFDISRETETLIPKRETGVTDFLRQHPAADGRGVVIAVIDTGVDPEAPGLRTTTLGEPKVIDVIDASGSGDVALSQPVKPAADGTLPGRTGRSLRLPDGLVNPSGEFRLGLKPAADLFGGEVLERIRQDLRRRWDAEERELVAQRDQRRRDDEAAGRRPGPQKPEADLTPAERDLLAREKLLAALEDAFDPTEAGPVFDCVVWHDGTHWRAILDTDADGNLASEAVLRPFGVARETGTFNGRTGSRFAVQVYDEGRTLSIVTVNGSHGTHVAAIAAAHFPDDPARNGVAPGARILSIRIGDPRLGGGSNGTGEQRALNACVQHGVQVANVSWGGPSDYQDGDRPIDRIYRKLVQDYGVVTFISVGNNGPALSTLGSPGETPEVISVGAYVSRDMARALYAVAGETPETPFHFSSRGPVKGGGLGVDILGPGAAIASMAFDSLASSALMNGTSMSAPSLAGVGALLVSAAQQAGWKATPHRVKAALANTARPLADTEPWAQGPGVAQVGPAHEHLGRNQDLPGFDLHYHVQTDDNPLAPGAGIYWREARPPGRHEARITVTPRFPAAITPKAQAAFGEDIVLQATQPWVEVPRFLHLAAGARNFRATIEVKPEPGHTIRYAEIRGFLARRPEAGPLFRIPVTIVTPHRIGATPGAVENLTAPLDAGGLVRRFYHVGPEVSHLRLRLRRDAADTLPRSYFLHSVALATHRPYLAVQFKESLRLGPGEEREFLVPVLPDRTVEVVLHQLWSSTGASALAAEVSAVAFSSNTPVVTLPAHGRFGEVVLQTAGWDLPVELTGRLTDAVMILAPVETRLLAGDERDVLPPSPLDAGPVRHPVLRQKFEFKVDKPFKVRAGLPGTNRAFAELLDGFTAIYHESGRLLWRGGDSSRTEVELPKGKITIYSDLRAPELAELKRLENAPLGLRRPLAPAPTLGIYPTARDAGRGRRETKLTLRPGRDHDVQVEMPSTDALTDLQPAPAWFLGELKVEHAQRTLATLPVIIQRGEPPPEQKRPAGEPPKAERPPLEEAREAIYQRRLQLVQGLRAKKGDEARAAHATLLAELRAERPDDPALDLEEARAIATRTGWLRDPGAPTESKTPNPQETGDVPAAEAAPEAEPAAEIAAAEAPTAPPAAEPSLEADFKAAIERGLSRIDTAAVAAFFGAPEQPPPEDAKARRELADRRREMTTRRDQARDLHLLQAEVAARRGQAAEARTALLAAQRWEATPSTPSRRWREVELAVLRAERRFGLALQVLQDHLAKDDPLARRWREMRAELYTELGWERWAQRERERLAIDRHTPQPRF